MICLECDCEQFRVKEDAEFTQIFKGNTYKVKSPGMVCCNCGWLTVGNNQIDSLVKATKDTFKKHTSLAREVDFLQSSDKIPPMKKELHKALEKLEKRVKSDLVRIEKIENLLGLHQWSISGRDGEFISCDHCGDIGVKNYITGKITGSKNKDHCNNN